MGCLFPCFRPRAAARSPSARDSVAQRGNDSKNRLSDLFLSQENAPPSPCHHREGSGLDSMHKDLKDQAQFLKACSTTPMTPIEIKKASENLETPLRTSQFDSWISSKSDAVFHLDERPDEPCGEVSEQTPSSCITDSQNSAKISAGYSDAGDESQGSIGTALRDGTDRTSQVPLTAGNITGNRKTVRFECDLYQSYSSSSSNKSTSKIPEKAEKSNLTATSQNLTSLKLSDEIQTHGTIFPENMESTIKGQPGVQACIVKTETESPSPWVKQSEEKSNNNMAALSTITARERPIIGMVAAHWNEKEQSQISPKWWDGNGIPNSTNKYKEDQKVSWHATPFEERLEKALSEEGGQGFIPPRKLEAMEETERDTAISQLHHSAQSTSIVSF